MISTIMVETSYFQILLCFVCKSVITSSKTIFYQTYNVISGTPGTIAALRSVSRVEFHVVAAPLPPRGNSTSAAGLLIVEN